MFTVGDWYSRAQADQNSKSLKSVATALLPFRPVTSRGEIYAESNRGNGL